MERPIVSIITPAFKCLSTIKDTFESIISQSFKDWEWLIVEDCSNDGTYEFVQQLAKQDKRIRVFKTSQNSGAAAARNMGIFNSNGKYIAFLDADDLWKPDKLKTQIEYMEINGYDFTFTDYDLLLQNGKIKKHKIKKQFVNFKDLLKRNYVGCLTAVYNADNLGKNYMPLDCEKREDHGAWLDITKKGINAYRLEECLSMYRVGNNSVSSNKIKMVKYQYLLYRKHLHFNVFKSLWYTIVCSLNKLINHY